MLSYSLMPKNYVSLCFLFSFVFIRSLYLQFLYFVFLSLRSFIFNALFILLITAVPSVKLRVQD